MAARALARRPVEQAQEDERLDHMSLARFNRACSNLSDNKLWGQCRDTFSLKIAALNARRDALERAIPNFAVNIRSEPLTSYRLQLIDN